eukprot:4130847-Alexandrium_andersonii.AAC.1
MRVGLDWGLSCLCVACVARCVLRGAPTKVSEESGGFSRAMPVLYKTFKTNEGVTFATAEHASSRRLQAPGSGENHGAKMEGN